MSFQATRMLTPGPTPIPDRVRLAMAAPLPHHRKDAFKTIMHENQDMLKKLFCTEGPVIPLACSGTGAMTASAFNLFEPGEKVLVATAGHFGDRWIDIAKMRGLDTVVLRWEAGKAIEPAAVREALDADASIRGVFMQISETSTGVRNPVQEVGDLVCKTNALYIVDAVTSLGGIPVEVDKWHADVCYSGGQKCLSCPPGASPITFSPKAMEVIHNRKTKVPNWYLDMNLLTQYWGGAKRVYHHTAPISMMYALYQAVYNVLEEGMENSFARHRAAHERLVKGLEELGMEMLVAPEYRLPELNCVIVPEGVDEAALRAELLNKYHIEISSGLGPLAGKVIRIGLMGYNATEHNVDRLLAALKEILGK